MARFNTVDQYINYQNNIIAKLRTGKRRGPITSARFMTAQLRATCPRGTKGHPGYPMMYQTIKRSRNRVRISGHNPNTGFPYIHWINDTPGTNLTTWGKKYADGSINRHGEPGFYWIALNKAARFNKESMINMTHKALSAEF